MWCYFEPPRGRKKLCSPSRTYWADHRLIMRALAGRGRGCLLLHASRVPPALERRSDHSVLSLRSMAQAAKHGQ